MGLGKTLQALGLLWALLDGDRRSSSGNQVKKAVVVCPSSLCGNWKAEVRKWLDGRLKPLVLTGGCGKNKVESQVRTFRDYTSHRLLVISYDQLRRHAHL